MGVALESAKDIINLLFGFFFTFWQDADAKTSHSSTLRPDFSSILFFLFSSQGRL